MNKIETFWKWFLDHNEPLTMLSDLEEKEQQHLLDELQRQLTTYQNGLTFEMGDPTPNGRTLTFSAEGDSDLFGPLLELTDGAPILDWWDVIPFKQPKGTDLKIIFDKYRFETKKMFFQQLQNEIEPDILGLRVALPDAVKNDEDQLVGVYVAIEALIGEFDCSTLVGYLETCPLPTDPKSEGFQPMDDLPDFIDWFKHERDQ
ncbi:MAG: hypothetical protein SPJ13_07570 [Bacteroidales bacterium]|nr:hypothetical protein [Bacteroidales bacterium]